MAGVIVREPAVDDAAAMGLVHVRAWQAAYWGGLMPDDYLDSLLPEDREAMWTASLDRPPRPRFARFVAEASGKLVGFIVVGPVEDEAAEPVRGRVYVVNVDPDQWGTGASVELFTAGVNALRSFDFAQAVLWVHPDNARARAFYERHGWSPDGASKHEEILGVGVPEIRYTTTITTR